jgi:hypothetical protein
MDLKDFIIKDNHINNLINIGDRENNSKININIRNDQKINIKIENTPNHIKNIINNKIIPLIIKINHKSVIINKINHK